MVHIESLFQSKIRKYPLRPPFRINKLEGNLALIAHRGTDGTGNSFWFNDNFIVSGSKLRHNSNRGFGPIVSTQHTLSRRILRITAQLMPIGQSDPLGIMLQYKDKNQSEWIDQAESEIDPSGYVAGFEVNPWNDTADYDYRVVYRMKDNQGKEQNYVYGGTIRKNPVDKEEITVAAFTGNNNTSWHSNTFDRKSIFFPHEDLTARVAMHNPDFYSIPEISYTKEAPPLQTVPAAVPRCLIIFINGISGAGPTGI
jgi:alkaline phosphatase D